jgi:hypothetical protein
MRSPFGADSWELFVVAEFPPLSFPFPLDELLLPPPQPAKAKLAAMTSAAKANIEERNGLRMVLPPF